MIYAYYHLNVEKIAKWTNMHIAYDKKIETFELDYDGKRDRWNEYDAVTYARNEEGEVSDKEGDDDDLKVDEAKVDEIKQMDFAKVEKSFRTTETHYDPKTRSMREDPLPDANPNEKFYRGDNQYKVSGQALEFKQLNIHSWEGFGKGQDILMQAIPSQDELLFKNYKVIKENLKSRMKDTIMDKYGNAAAEEELPRELLLGQSEQLLRRCRLSFYLLNTRSSKGDACRSFEIEWETRRNVAAEEGGKPSRNSGQTEPGPIKEHSMNIDGFLSRLERWFNSMVYVEERTQFMYSQTQWERYQRFLRC
ncbi:Pre-mRNA-splicing factor SLU7-A [Vitis vinifera]|uniref:Pre-mRNA-splicing factor SLU7 n=1 Tax=Vitis vinifera TaxID=29760 RepID=A0A438EHY1_VITVI|nr:Pre-mRNA-splicing factor SLU7-A [Vitis vinifera]